MNTEFRTPLPDKVKAIVDEIEAAACIDVVVQRDPALPTDMCAAWLQKNGSAWPVILYREAWDCTSGVYPEPYAMVTHEILHLQRMFVERVPIIQIQGVRVTDQAGKPVENTIGQPFSSSEFESTLEHLVIEPRMLRYGFKPTYKITVEPGAYSGQLSACGRWHLMLHWLFAVFVYPDARQSLVPIMRKTGLYELAVWTSKAVRAVINSKEATAAVAALGCGIPLWALELSYIEGRTIRRAPLPEQITVQTPRGKLTIPAGSEDPNAAFRAISRHIETVTFKSSKRGLA